jgi:hypothetical protein
VRVVGWSSDVCGRLVEQPGWVRLLSLLPRAGSCLPFCTPHALELLQGTQRQVATCPHVCSHLRHQMPCLVPTAAMRWRRPTAVDVCVLHVPLWTAGLLSAPCTHTQAFLRLPRAGVAAQLCMRAWCRLCNALKCVRVSVFVQCWARVCCSLLEAA